MDGRRREKSAQPSCFGLPKLLDFPSSSPSSTEYPLPPSDHLRSDASEQYRLPVREYKDLLYDDRCAGLRLVTNFGGQFNQDVSVYSRAHVDSVVLYRLQRLNQILIRVRLQNVAVNSERERRFHQVFRSKQGDKEDLRPRAVLEDLPRRLQPVHLGHGNIHDDDIGS
jgi:hypothetical protein